MHASAVITPAEPTPAPAMYPPIHGVDEAPTPAADPDAVIPAPPAPTEDSAGEIQWRTLG